MHRGIDGKFISRAQVGGGKSVLRMKGTPDAVLRKKELREKRRMEREILKAVIRP